MTSRSGGIMSNLSICRTSDLLPAAKQAVEAVLGRKLADDEEVGIWASGPHQAPAGVARREAWEKLTEHAEFMASKLVKGSADDLGRIIDEAADEVRHGRAAPSEQRLTDPPGYGR
jgi:hypothetical protein